MRVGEGLGGSICVSMVEQLCCCDIRAREAGGEFKLGGEVFLSRTSDMLLSFIQLREPVLRKGQFLCRHSCPSVRECSPLVELRALCFPRMICQQAATLMMQWHEDYDSAGSSGICCTRCEVSALFMVHDFVLLFGQDTRFELSYVARQPCCTCTHRRDDHISLLYVLTISLGGHDTLRLFPRS